MRGKFVFLISKSKSLFHIFLSVFNYSFCRFSLCLLEMIMLINFGGDCSLTKTRRTIGRVTFHIYGPMMGQYVLLMAKCHILYTNSLFQ